MCYSGSGYEPSEVSARISISGDVGLIAMKEQNKKLSKRASQVDKTVKTIPKELKKLVINTEGYSVKDSSTKILQDLRYKTN